MNEKSIEDFDEIIKTEGNKIICLFEKDKIHPTVGEIILYRIWRHFCRVNDTMIGMDESEHFFNEYWENTPKNDGDSSYG